MDLLQRETLPRTGSMLICMTWLRLTLLLCMRYCQGYKAMIVPGVAHDAVVFATRVSILTVHRQALCLALLQQIDIESLHVAATLLRARDKCCNHLQATLS